jgi:PAS domain-containing protein
MDQFSDAVDTTRERGATPYAGADRHSVRDRHDQLLAAFEELTLAEEELRAQQENLLETRNLLEIQRNRYLTLFDHAPDPYVVTDGAGVIEEANAAAADLFGVPGKLLVGKPLVTFVDQRARSDFRAHLNSLAGGAPIDKWTIDARVRRCRRSRDAPMARARCAGCCAT